MGRKPLGRPRHGAFDGQPRLPSEYTVRWPDWSKKLGYCFFLGLPLMASVGHFVAPHRARDRLGAGFMNGPERFVEELLVRAEDLAAHVAEGATVVADDDGRFLVTTEEGARILATETEAPSAYTPAPVPIPKTRRPTPVPSISVPPTVTPVPTRTFAPTFVPTATFAPTIEEFLRVQYLTLSFSEVLGGMAVTFGSIFFVMLMLKLLLDMAMIEIDELPRYRRVRDKFQSAELGQNWNYDFVIVTSVKNEGHEITSENQRKNTMLRIVSALSNADLQTEQYEPGQDKGNSTSLQHECSRSNAREKSIHALTSPREMIARPKMSQNEWKTTEI